MVPQMDEPILLEPGDVSSARIFWEGASDKVRRAIVQAYGEQISRRRLNHRVGRQLHHSKQGTELDFAVPTCLAEAAIGHSLEIEMPTMALHTRMHDWVRAGGQTWHTGYWFVSSGDWSRLLLDASDSAVMREARQLKECDFDFRETASYQRYVRGLDEDFKVVRNRVHLDSREKLDAYFERYVRLFRSIQRHGVLRIAEAAPRQLASSTAPDRDYPVTDEQDIGIAIGPDGDPILLPGAKHRLAIATLLELATVPVQIRMVHTNWLRQLDNDAGWCNRIANGIADFDARHAAGREGQG